MGRFQRIPHHANIAGGVECVVSAALRQIDEIGNDVAVDFGRIDEMGHAEALGHFLAAIVDIDANDHVGARQPQALHDVQTNAAEAKDDAVCPLLNLRRVHHRADAGGHAATDIADLVERRVLTDFRRCDLGHHRVVRKGRRAHVVQDRIAIQCRESARPIGHQALPLRRPDRLAKVRLWVQAVLTFPTFRGVQRDDMVARFQRFDARAAFDDDSGALMAKDRGEHAFGVSARKGKLVCVANAGRLDLNQNFALTRAVQINFGDFKRATGLGGHCGAGFHASSPRWTLFHATFIEIHPPRKSLCP